jgi:hypothetical protein
VWTDGASYLADGTLMTVSGKVEILAHLNAVVAARAPSLFLPLIAHHLGQAFDTFDAMVAGLSEAVQVGVALHSRIFDLCDLGADFDLIVVGWSNARGRCETWTLFSQDRGDAKAWTAHEMGPVMLAPYDGPLGDRLALTDAQLAGGLHPIDDGLRIIEAQRAVAAPQGGRAQPSHGVGAFAQMTLVGRDHIETRIMRRWPDPIGAPLGTAA